MARKTTSFQIVKLATLWCLTRSWQTNFINISNLQSSATTQNTCLLSKGITMLASIEAYSGEKRSKKRTARPESDPL
jgi:hypothetical protein